MRNGSARIIRVLVRWRGRFQQIGCRSSSIAFTQQCYDDVQKVGRGQTRYPRTGVIEIGRTRTIARPSDRQDRTPDAEGRSDRHLAVSRAGHRGRIDRVLLARRLTLQRSSWQWLRLPGC